MCCSFSVQSVFSQYYFSAQVSSNDPCCISIGAGSHSGQAYEGMWSVVVDGTTYDTNDGNNILHCVNQNGTYTVDFIVDGYHNNPYWSRDVQVTGCGSECCLQPDLDDITVTPISNSNPPLYEVCVESDCLSGTEYRFRCREVTNPPSSWMDTYYITSNCVWEQFDDCKTYEIQVGYWTSECGLTDLSDSYFYTTSGDCEDSCADECNLYQGQITTHFITSSNVGYFSHGQSSITYPCSIPNKDWSVSGGTITGDWGSFVRVQFNGTGNYELCVELDIHNGEEFCDPVEICESGFITGLIGNNKDSDYASSLAESRIHQGTQLLDANIYPNPANEHVTFEIGALEDMDAQIILMNNSGQIVRNYTQRLNTGTTRFTIDDLSTLSEGIYFYHILTDNHTKSGKISIFK